MTPALSKFYQSNKYEEGYLSSDTLSGNEMDIDEAKKKVQPKRGRPPTTGEYVGLAKAKADLLRLRQEELKIQAEEEVGELASRARRLRAAKKANRPAAKDLLAMDLKAGILSDADLILKVVDKSKNLKGTCQRALNDAAKSIAEMAVTLAETNTTEELTRLQEAYANLKANEEKQALEISKLREELAQMRADFVKVCAGDTSNKTKASVDTSPPRKKLAREGSLSVARQQNEEHRRIPHTPAMTRPREEFPPLPERIQMVPQVDPSTPVTMGMLDQAVQTIMLRMDAGMDNIKDRLLPEKRIRPPLAADKRAATTAASVVAAPPPKLPGSQQPTRNTDGKKAAQKNTHTSKQKPHMEGEWVLVGRNGRPMKPTKRQKKKAAPEVKKPKKLRPPKTTAVSVTLQPEAREKGLSYLEVLQKIKSDVKMADIGIEKLKWRKTATGGYLLEVPGAASGDKADALAAKIRQAVPADVAKVSRPTRSAFVRISGLDESVTTQEVINAVATTTECPPEQIKSNGIHLGPRGLCSTVVSCPVAAAKKLEEERHLLLGWVSANVKVLPPRTQKCYRCLQDGHLGIKCSSMVDCSQLCFRCSQPGHKASGCSADPHCAVCAASNKPAGHRVGSRTCAKQASPPNKGGKKKGEKRMTNPSLPSTSSGACEAPPIVQAVDMECQQ